MRIPPRFGYLLHMQASIVIASHNEGQLILRTVDSVHEMAQLMRMEVIVADDASSDGSIAELKRRHPDLKVLAHEKRLGPSPTKDLGARAASGECLIFLDGHTRPDKGALLRLMNRVREERGQAIITPRVLKLDPETWSYLP